MLGHLRSSVAVLVLMAAWGLAGCGGSSAPTPTDVAQSYMAALAEGNYSSACAMLTPQAQAILVSRVARHRSCTAAFHHCIPVNPLTLKRDQSQLLFASVLPTIQGTRASVEVSGTRVARELRRLTMLRGRHGWRITGPGRILARCRPAAHKHPRHRRA